jgi:hypothetical protein
MSSVRQRLMNLVDRLATKATAIVLVRQGIRLLPATIDDLRLHIADAVGEAKRIGELHAGEQDPKPDDDGRSILDTSPGMPSVKPPKPTKH